MAQGEPFGGAVSPAKPVDQGLLQGTLGSLSSAGEVEAPAQHLAGAAIEDGNKRAPPILAALDEGDIRAPALIGFWGNRSGPRHPRALTNGPLAHGPALDPHEAVDLFAVGGLVQTMLQPGPYAANAVGRMGLNYLVDGPGQSLVHRAVHALNLGLVVGRGPGYAQDPAEAGHRDLHPRLQHIAPHRIHEIPSGKSLPRMR